MKETVKKMGKKRKVRPHVDAPHTFCWISAYRPLGVALSTLPCRGSGQLCLDSMFLGMHSFTFLHRHMPLLRDFRQVASAMKIH